jgi:hypothetical protein
MRVEVDVDVVRIPIDVVHASSLRRGFPKFNLAARYAPRVGGTPESEMS